MDEHLVTIQPEMYLIIQGQLNTLRQKIDRLDAVLKHAGMTPVAPFVAEIYTELDFLYRYLPVTSGDIPALVRLDKGDAGNGE